MYKIFLKNENLRSNLLRQCSLHSSQSFVHVIGDFSDVLMPEREKLLRHDREGARIGETAYEIRLY